MLMQDNTLSQNNFKSDCPSKRSSSQKIDLLYAQFQNLKARINKSTSKKKQASSNNSAVMPNPDHQRNRSNFNKQYKSREIHSQRLLEKSQAALNNTGQFFKMTEGEASKPNIELVQIKYLIRKGIEGFISNHLSKFENEALDRIESLQRKLKISEETIKKMKTILNIKKLKRQKLAKMEATSVKGSNEALCDVVLQYQKKIAELVEEYQQRMEIAEQKGRDKQTYSSTVKSRQINNTHEKEIMQKETEINKLKLNYHKLKRSYEQTKDKYENCLLQLEQIEFKASMKIQQSIQVEVQSLKANQIKQQELQSLKQQIWSKDSEIQRLLDIIAKTQQKPCKEQSIKIDEPQRPAKQEQKSPQSCIPVTQVQEKHVDQQFYTQLEQIEADFNIFNQKFTKSQIIQPRRKKSVLESLKSLQLEVNLISEQNRHLQSKKVLFENQLKNTEVDEERFVMQSNLFKDQIKRLNTSLQLLDKVVCQFVKEGKLDPSKVQELPQDLKAKSVLSDVSKQNLKKK